MGTITQGAWNVIRVCLRIKSGEGVVIITDTATAEVGWILKSCAKKVGGRVTLLNLDSIGKRPVSLSSDIVQALTNTDVGIFAAENIDGEIETLRSPLVTLTATLPRIRYAHMVGITPQIMRESMCADYKEVAKLTDTVHEQLVNAKQIRVITKLGTDIVFTFHGHRWNAENGIIIPGNAISNLPAGVVWTCPYSVHGRAVVDGSAGDRLEKYGVMKKTPLIFNIVDGRVVPESIICKNHNISRDFKNYMFDNGGAGIRETVPNVSRIGEFGIGTNTSVSEFSGMFVQDEKIPGAYFAVGDSYPADTGADWESSRHMDLKPQNTTVLADDEVIMNNGKYIDSILS